MEQARRLDPTCGEFRVIRVKVKRGNVEGGTVHWQGEGKEKWIRGSEKSCV